MHFSKLIIGALLASCSIADTPPTVPQGIWHNDDQLAEFTDYWSTCKHFRAVTSDDVWVLDIDATAQAGRRDVAELVSLLNFSQFQDRKCAISLLKLNDIACESIDPERLAAIQGDGMLRVNRKNPEWETTVDVDFRDLVFIDGTREIRIDRVFYSNIKLANFCPG